ncbi:MAG: TIGR04255 family protein [Planctomycetaceae bacterium]|nr:TIGR04255 family protein [Planctomycetaceae bacterium]
MPQLLPEFEHPPVVEVALSVQFDRLDVATPQLALVWQRFRDRFGRVEDKPELEAAFERFAPTEKRAQGVRFEIGSFPGMRFWFVNESGHELVQVQRDRFVRNWRKTEEQPEYPRYGNLRAAFVTDWSYFETFAKEELDVPLVPNQCEVTYVNIIEAKGPGRLCDVLSIVNDRYTEEYLNEPETAELQFHFALKGNDEKPWGRLHVEAGPAIRMSDNRPVVRLSLTARGNPPSQDCDGMLASLDSCHEAVVRGFSSITTPAMHKAWGRKL